MLKVWQAHSLVSWCMRATGLAAASAGPIGKHCNVCGAGSTDQCPRGSSQQQNAHANLCEQLHFLELLCCLMF